MKRLSALALLALLSLLLAACGGADPSSTQPPQPPPAGDAVISGTLTAAPGGDVAGTTIRACLDADCETAAQTITVSEAGTSASFTISGLREGPSYTLQALQDANDNGVADAEEASGTAGPVEAPAQGVSLTLQAESTPSPDDDPAPGQDSDLQGTWSGTGTRTDTDQSFVLALDVTQVDEASGSVDAVVTFNGAIDGAFDMSGTFEGTDLSLASESGRTTFTITVSGGAMEGQGSIALTQSGDTAISFTLTKGQGDAPPPDDLPGTWSGSGTRTDTDQAFDLVLDVAQVDEADGSVSATATFSGGIGGSVDMSGTLDGTNLSLVSSGGGITFTITVSSTAMEGAGSANLRDSGATPIAFTLSKGDDAPPGNSLSGVALRSVEKLASPSAEQVRRDDR